MKLISSASTPPGILGIGAFLDNEIDRLVSRLPQTAGLVLVLAEVRDPGNVGTILRTAWASGVDAVFLGEACADLYNSKVVRATAGGIFHIPISREVAVAPLLGDLRVHGYQCVGATPQGPRPYDDVDMNSSTAIVVGNEAWGFSEIVKSALDIEAFVPMKGRVDSLNVGVAACLFMFEAARQRRHG